MISSIPPAPIAPAVVLKWFHSIPNSHGANVRLEDVQQLAHMLTLFRDTPRLEPVRLPQMEAMREALEAIIQVAPTFLANGDQTLRNERETGTDEQILEDYDDMQRDLRGVLEATRILLLNGRFRYQPSRKKDARGAWHQDALFIGSEVCLILTTRSNQSNFGLGTPTAPAISVVKAAMRAALNLVLSEEAIVRGIRLQVAKDNFYKQAVSIRAKQIRGKITPDTPEHPGKLESDDEQPVAASDSSRSED